MYVKLFNDISDVHQEGTLDQGLDQEQLGESLILMPRYTVSLNLELLYCGTLVDESA